MAREEIDLTTPIPDTTPTRYGESAKTAFQKINAMTLELYTAIGAGSGGGPLISTNNLDDLGDLPTALANLGLDEVDNTSDADKPVSTLQATAISDASRQYYGDTDPTTIASLNVGPGFVWAHQTPGLRKRRNDANTDWVVEGTLFVRSAKITGDTFTGDVDVDGELSEAGSRVWTAATLTPSDYVLNDQINRAGFRSGDKNYPYFRHADNTIVDLATRTVLFTAIGSYAMLKFTGATAVSPGDVVSGVSLVLAAAGGFGQASSTVGSWMLMGRYYTSGGADDPNRVSLWQRVS